MSRRKTVIRQREVAPDAVYGSEVVSRFINYMMMAGKKSISERIFYKAMNIIQEKAGQPGIEIFDQAIEKARPQVEVRSRRMGGVTYQVPIEVPTHRMQTLAIRWLVKYARQRKEHTMQDRLAMELMDAARSQGGAVRRRDEIRRTADANRAFSHYRW